MAIHFLKFLPQFGLRLGPSHTSVFKNGSAAYPSVIGQACFVCAASWESERIGYALRILLGVRQTSCL